MADQHADLAHHDHVHGQMEITEQAGTWALFQFLAKWCSLAVSVLVVMLVIWFCTNAGFLAGAISGVVVAVAGYFVLRQKKAAAH